MKPIFLLSVFVLAVGSLFAAGAHAQVDYSANNLGFYFDEAATQTAIATGTAESATAYFVVTGLSYPGALTAWNVFPIGVCPIESDGNFPADYESLFFEIIPRAGTGISVAGGFPNWLGLEVAFDEPLVVSDTVILAELNVSIVTEAPLGIYCEGGGLLEYESGETRNLAMATYPITGSMPPPLWLQATINSDIVPVATEQCSFGSLKSLFR